MPEFTQNQLKRKVLNRAKALKCTVESVTRFGHLEVNIMSPDGFHFSSEKIHEMVNSAWDGDSDFDVWKEAWRRFGFEELEKCLPDCEWCYGPKE